jgi:putative endonuclease
VSKFAVGLRAQKIAEEYLSARGCEILARNYRRRDGEIDLIARENPSGYILFIEVKFRASTDFGLPRESVNNAKQQKIIQTAKHFIAQENLHDNDFRFDVIEILGEDLNHIENAFWL